MWADSRFPSLVLINDCKVHKHTFKLYNQTPRLFWLKHNEMLLKYPTQGVFTCIKKSTCYPIFASIAYFPGVKHQALT